MKLVLKQLSDEDLEPRSVDLQDIEMKVMEKAGSSLKLILTPVFDEDVTDVGPIYTESLSVEQESILEIIDEEISMFADDELDGQIIVIRHDRVKAKIQEKKKSVN
jgi:hypothetical protein